MRYQALLNGKLKEITPEQADAMVRSEKMLFGWSNVCRQLDEDNKEVCTLIPFSASFVAK